MNFYSQSFLSAFLPKPDITTSEWADRERILSKEDSAEPGKWNTSRAEYQRGIMDAVSDPSVYKVVVMSSSQIGKTSILQNIIGYYIHHEPSPILVILPTIELAKTFSKDRLKPMVRDTPALSSLINIGSVKTSDSTILHKVFRGGHITLAGANSPASLSSRPIKVLLCDEIDRYPISAGDEGDPTDLAIKRTTAFWDKKIVLTSTPTLKGVSRIEKAYALSDQRKFYVPCIKCGYYQTLEWENVVWDKDDYNTARYLCPNCLRKLNDYQLNKMISKGEWRAETDFNGVAGFYVNELYSTWVTLAETVKAYLDSKIDTEKYKVWVNTTLGLPYEDEAEEIEANTLTKRKESYTKIPNNVLLLTMGVDVQGDRLEYEIVGWGLGEESWGIAYNYLRGDPERPEVWQQLYDVINTPIERADGSKMRISCTCIDSGYKTKMVYKFVKNKERQRIYAVKGASSGTSVTVSKGSRNNKGNVLLFSIGVDQMKQMLFSRLKIQDKGAGYMHFPEYYDDLYFEQLTAERLVKKYKNGFPYFKWVKVKERNEAIDLRVYNFAAFEILQPNLPAIAKRMLKQFNEDEPKKKKQPHKKTGVDLIKLRKQTKPTKKWSEKWRE